MRSVEANNAPKNPYNNSRILILLIFFPMSTSLIHTDSLLIHSRNNANTVWRTTLTNKTSSKWRFSYCTIVLRINSIKADEKDNDIPINFDFHVFSFSSSSLSLYFFSKTFFSEKESSYTARVMPAINITDRVSFSIWAAI